MESTEGLSKRSMDPKDENAPADPQEDKYHGRTPAGPKRGGYRSLAIAVSLPLVLGIAQGVLFPPDNWYSQLKRPSWNPPGWVFGLVWTLVYPLMGLASWLVWANGGWQKQSRPLSLYVLQLALNLIWTPVFFKLHSPLLALVIIVALVVTVAACITAFRRANPVAANIMQLYLAWLLFATAITFTIWYSNIGMDQIGGSASRAAKDSLDAGMYQAQEGMYHAKDGMHHAKDSLDAGMHHAKDNLDSGMHHAKDNLDSGMHHTKASVDSGMHQAKDSLESGMHHAKANVDSGMHHAKDSLDSGMHHAKATSHKVVENMRDSVATSD